MKKQCSNPLTFLFTFLHQNLFNIQKHLALALKKIAHVLFCVFQANLNKAVNIFFTLSAWIRNIQNDTMPWYYKDFDENLAWITQITVIKK